LRVILADDHQIVREGLRALLDRHSDIAVVGEAANGREAIQVARETRPNVAVLDLSMPELNGLDAGREILASGTGTRIVLLTMHREDHHVTTALRAGISGYVLKSRASDLLVQAIKEVAEGHIYLSPCVSRSVVEAFLSPDKDAGDVLTSRERQILQLIAEGKTTKEIAYVLGLSVKTAESHRSRIMDKLNIHDIAGLVRYAIRLGLVQP
jgi:DNA-binding NarL/FixJ family response regulator